MEDVFLNAASQANARGLPANGRREILMNRSLVFIAALLFAAITVSSACIATPASDMPFTLRADRADQRVQLTFSRGGERHDGTMSRSFAPGELSGLDFAAIRAPGQRP